MRNKIGKVIREKFTRELKNTLPQFDPLELSGSTGNLLFRWKIADNLNCFVFLQMSAKQYEDNFTVELACSAMDDYPFKQGARGPDWINKDGSVRFRLPQLYVEEWRPQTAFVPWWWVGPRRTARELSPIIEANSMEGKITDVCEGMLPIDEALLLVEPQVQDAVDRVKQFGIPFFLKFAEKQKPT